MGLVRDPADTGVMTVTPTSQNQTAVVERIAAILSERYEPYGAMRIALRIVEAMRAGDRLTNDLAVVPVEGIYEGNSRNSDLEDAEGSHADPNGVLQDGGP